MLPVLTHPSPTRRSSDLLAGAGLQHAPRRRHVGDAAGNAERDVDLPRHALDPGRVDAAHVRAGADVVEHQLVGAGIAIARRPRDDVTPVDLGAEAHALDHATGTHYAEGDDTAWQNARGPGRWIRPARNPP